MNAVTEKWEAWRSRKQPDCIDVGDRLFLSELWWFSSLFYMRKLEIVLFLVLVQSVIVLGPESCLLFLWWDGIELRIRRNYGHMGFKMQAHTVKVVSWIFLEYLSWGGWKIFHIGDSLCTNLKSTFSFHCFPLEKTGFTDGSHYGWWNQMNVFIAVLKIPLVTRFFHLLGGDATLNLGTLLTWYHPCLSPGAKFIIELRDMSQSSLI